MELIKEQEQEQAPPAEADSKGRVERKFTVTRHTNYCRPEMKGKHTQRTSNRYCPECKMRIRGKYHEEGLHHKGIALKRA